MFVIYLDYNCFQRSFDDPGKVRIQLEALACQEIFGRAEAGQIKLVWSFMHEDETILCPFPERQYEVSRLSLLCQIRLGPEQEILRIAKEIQEKAGMSAKDAMHLACACYVKADYFLTCDDKLIKKSRKIEVGIEIMNPLDFVRLETYYG
jgi:predicted nucleic acid-binding protein